MGKEESTQNMYSQVAIGSDCCRDDDDVELGVADVDSLSFDSSDLIGADEEIGQIQNSSQSFWNAHKIAILCLITWASSFTTNYIADVGRQYYQDDISSQTLTSYQQGFLFLFVIFQKLPTKDFKLFSKETSSKLVGIGFLRMMAQYLGNSALLMFSLNFAIYTVVKASKILLLLLMGCFMLKVPSASDVKIGFALFVSLVLFQYPSGDQEFKITDLYGIFFMFMCIGCNTFAQLSTEKILKSATENVDGLDVMMLTQIIPVLMLLVDVLMRGLLPSSIVGIVFLQALSNYVAVRTSLKLTALQSSFFVTVVNVTRRIATVIVSLFTSSGPIGIKDSAGLLCFLAASYLIYEKKASK